MSDRLRALALFAIVALFATASLAPSTAHAIVIDLGSDGSDGALNVTVDTVLPLPADGLFQFTTVNIASGARLSFSYPGEFHPGVVILAQGDVVIDGTIDVSGMDSPSTGVSLAGPGGTRGGYPRGWGSSNTFTARAILDFATTMSGGSSLRIIGATGGNGEIASSSTCTSPTRRGGGGGGAIQILSNQTIRGAGTITAAGGAGSTTSTCGGGSSLATAGSDGNIALVSNRIDGAGLTLVANNAYVRTYARIGDPSAVSRTGAARAVNFSDSVQPWQPLPTAAITHVNGVAVVADTFYGLPPGTTSPLTVRVRVTGCVGSSLTALVQRSGQVGGHPTYLATLASPTGTDDVDVSVPAATTAGNAYTLRTGFYCVP